MTPFVPLLRNGHLATIVTSFWPRHLDESRFPVEAKLFPTEPSVKVLAHIQRPAGDPRGEVILLHGLEGSSDSSYLRGLAHVLLEAGFAVHRLNMRSCGGTEFHCTTLYHAGLTSDLFTYLMDLDRLHRTPVFLAGFSLGGNVVLKLAGEMQDDAHRLIAGVCTVSTPLDLELCARRIGLRSNFFYQRLFVSSMRKRLRLRHPVLPDSLPWGRLDAIHTLYDWDDQVTAPSFGFQGAHHYYSTQSANRFLDRIRVPALIIHAQNDPLVDFAAYSHPALAANPAIRTLITAHGGHIGFLARSRPRLWLDSVIAAWIAESGNS